MSRSSLPGATTNNGADTLHDEQRSCKPRGSLHDLVTGEWFSRTSPQPPGDYSPWELLPGVGVGVTVYRLTHDDPSLLDRFSGHVLVPLYHIATVSALYGIGTTIARYVERF